jgi:gas vesicle protein
MDERKMSFGARRALAIIGSTSAVLLREKSARDADSKALREQDRQVLESVNDKRNAREVVASAGLEFETGLNSIAWLIRTGFIYSAETVKLETERQADRLELFVELFSDHAHGREFWQEAVAGAVRDNSSLEKAVPGIRWDGLSPEMPDPSPSPARVREYFLELFVSLYDRAEEVFGSEAVIAKRILLDVKPLA